MKDAYNKALSSLQRERCEFLGLKDDPQTSLAFVSHWNYCYFARPPSPVRPDHQRRYCQTAAHLACSVLLQKRPAALPADLRAPRQRPAYAAARRTPLVPLILAVLALLGAALWYAAHLGLISLSDLGPAAQWYEIFFPSTVASPLVLPTEASVRPLAGSEALLTSPPAPVLTAAPTWTRPPQQHALEAPVRVGDRTFLIHSVKRGETFDVLTQSYDTTSEVIRSLNGDLKSSLWADTQIVISPGLKGVDPSLPTLQAYQVQDTVITIDELAGALGVTSELLRLYNGCSGNCTLVQGDWMIVPRPR